MKPLMRRLLPAVAEVTEVRGELSAPPLFPEEEAVVARSVVARRREFATGRRCARLSLAALGLPARPLLSGERGEPLWPEGVVGALSHCAGYRVAAVARATDLAALGIDAETAGPLPDGVLEAVSLPEERAQLSRLRASVPHVPWDRLLFSAKESVYKAWFPLARTMLGFDMARLGFTVVPDAGSGVRGTFSARLLRPLPAAFADAIGGPVLDGWWLVDEGLVLTAIAPPACRTTTGPGDETSADRAGPAPSHPAVPRTSHRSAAPLSAPLPAGTSHGPAGTPSSPLPAGTSRRSAATAPGPLPTGTPHRPAASTSRPLPAGAPHQSAATAPGPLPAGTSHGPAGTPSSPLPAGAPHRSTATAPGPLPAGTSHGLAGTPSSPLPADTSHRPTATTPNPRPTGTSHRPAASTSGPLPAGTSHRPAATADGPLPAGTSRRSAGTASGPPAPA
ncbi:4'-phosphopantetheinyl transferase family protein [Streptomyces sp. NBC_00557]|uniref:4'-phosphopantetheinyl transferase family protein n=1 Tax=Streptomyces sp. NBC_00557 TaxID=2975776 RepID=UPI002E818B74|nr:4'-phosphopantetheinyl transferase superfamily protein [Streptomyces sp. NBC_00557]WUC33008.1 4'-phosphopantetheinyl transferase superfamily protein [Streptomyces sp. NBC_00557]